MDIFGGIEKLITEHGSAAILKERLLLVADKYAALEKTLAACETNAKDAVSEKEHLELENLKLKEEIRSLKEQLTERPGARLPEIEEKLLVFLAEDVQYAPKVATELKMNKQAVLHHFEELEKLSMVEGWRAGGYDTEWHLKPEGRSYLVLHELLP